MIRNHQKQLPQKKTITSYKDIFAYSKGQTTVCLCFQVLTNHWYLDLDKQLVKLVHPYAFKFKKIICIYYGQSQNSENLAFKKKSENFY